VGIDLVGFIRAAVNRVARGDGDSGMRAPRGSLAGLTVFILKSSLIFAKFYLTIPLPV